MDGLYGHGCGWHDIDIEWYSPHNIIYKRDLVYTIVDMIARHTLNHDVTLFLGSVVSVPMGPMFVLRTIFCIFLFRTCYSESRRIFFLPITFHIGIHISTLRFSFFSSLARALARAIVNYRSCFFRRKKLMHLIL